MKCTIIGYFLLLVTMVIGQDIYSPLYKTLFRYERSSYRGLFLSEKQISNLKSSLQDKSLSIYKLASAKERMTLSVSCGSSAFSDTRTSGACGQTESATCCETILEVIQPETVTGVLDNIVYNVSTSEHGVQILHIGKCAQEESSCNLGGICLQENRISWLLVDTGEFVPVEVPNHCVCIYV